MAETLVKSMVGKWDPDEYHDDFRDRLTKVIEARIKAKGGVRAPSAEEVAMPKNASTNVVDFMSLLKKSIDTHQRTPAKKSGAAAKKSGGHHTAARRKSSTRKKASKDS